MRFSSRFFFSRQLIEFIIRRHPHQAFDQNAHSFIGWVYDSMCVSAFLLKNAYWEQLVVE